MACLSLEKHLQEFGFQTKPRISVLKPEERTNYIEDFELLCIRNGFQLDEEVLRAIIVNFYTQIKREALSMLESQGKHEIYGFRDQPLNLGLNITYFRNKAYITVMTLHQPKPPEEDIIHFAE